MKFKCIQYDWDKVLQLCKILADKIKKSNFKPDVIVAVARGGWIPARILADISLLKNCIVLKLSTGV